MKAALSDCISTDYCLLATVYCFSLPCLKHSVEGRLGGAAELFEACAGDHLAQGVLGGDRAERGAAERERVRGAAERRGRRERPADDVDVLFDAVAGHRLAAEGRSEERRG